MIYWIWYFKFIISLNSLQIKQISLQLMQGFMLKHYKRHLLNQLYCFRYVHNLYSSLTKMAHAIVSTYAVVTFWHWITNTYTNRS